MYVKNKFVNLEYLHFTDQWFKDPQWPLVTDLQLDEIMDFLLRLRKFYVSLDYHVEPKLVNKMFDSFINRQRSNESPNAQKQVAFEFSLVEETSQEGFLIKCGKDDVPTMQVDMFDNNDTAMTDLCNMIKHIGSSIHILKLDLSLLQCNNESLHLDDFSRNMIDCIHAACPDLQTLSSRKQEILISMKKVYPMKIFTDSRLPQ